MPTVSATFKLDNLDYTWYSSSTANAATFDQAFIALIAAQFGVNPNNVVILNVTAGSIIVGFQIIATSDSQATALSTSVNSFVSSPSTAAPALGNLAASLPPAAFRIPPRPSPSTSLAPPPRPSLPPTVAP